MTSAAARELAGRVCFTDIQRFLSLFAQGLAARFLHVKVIETSAAGNGAKRIIDGESIHLPAEIADFAAREHNLGAYRIAVLHQVGFLVEGTLDFDLAGFLQAHSRPALLRRVFATIEDLRIDAAIRRRYPGARGDLDRVLAHALASRPHISTMQPVPALVEALLQYSLGAAPAAVQDGGYGDLLGRLIATAAAVQREGAHVDDSARAALSICEELEKLFRRPPRHLARVAHRDLVRPTESIESLDEEEFSEGEAAGLSVEYRGELIAVASAKRLTGGQIVAGGPDTAAATKATVAGSSINTENAGASPRSAPAMVRSAVSAGPRSFLYDEWDFHQQSYLAAWCRVYEQRLRGDDFGFIGGVRSRHSALEKEVRRRFGSIKPLSWQRVRRTSDGDELDLDGVIESVIDRRTGHDADSHLYIRRDRARRDVSAAFLVDMSASTDFPLPDPAATKVAPADVPTGQPPDGGLYLYGGQEEYSAPRPPPKRRVIDVAKDALALMCEALQRLGDNYAIYGFSGDGRHNVEFHVAKDFADRLTSRTWAALGAMQPRRSTRMGAAIRHAIAKLGREPAGMKVLIILSDGYPEDHDYGADRTDREYGIQDTARALQEAQRAGIVDFCITIDPAGQDYLRRMCAPSRYLIIDDVTALPRELSKVYRTLTS
ncbi:MAG: nitric oxide reductase activation protein NorD [Steroidobacteraceae bacterium]